MQWFINEVRERFAALEERLAETNAKVSAIHAPVPTQDDHATYQPGSFSARIRQLENEIRMIKARMSRRIYGDDKAA